MNAIVKNELPVFFSYVGQHATFEDKSVLWSALAISQIMSQNLVQNMLDINFFRSALSFSNLQTLERTENGEFYARYLLGKQDSTDYQTLLLLIEDYMNLYKQHKNSLTPHINDLSVDHLLKMSHYAFIGFLVILVYYAYSFFGALGLLSITSLGVYWGILKLKKKLTLQHEKEQVRQELRKAAKTEQKLSTTSLGEAIDPVLDSFRLWDSQALDLSTRQMLEKLKIQLIYFSRIYKNRANIEHDGMHADALRMSREHIPALIEQIKQSSTNTPQAMSAFESMNRVITQHIEELLWADKREISVKNRYWLNKLSEEHALEKTINEN